ncbi:MAG: YciI family protein [Marmoricola sp.]
MTQYMISVIHPEEGPDWVDEGVDVQEVVAQVDAFNQELQASGSWVFAGGLEPPSRATVVDATGTDVLVTDGPYAETKEQLGGFWVVEAADLEAALTIAKKGSAACRGAVEVRPFQAE